jgi:hypothetical protein
MKSASPCKEKNENMPSMCIPSEERDRKSVLQHVSLRTNQGQEEKHFGTRIPEVICRNKELLSSFQILRTKTIAMGHPSHYFQRALNSFTQKRSQSLPSCLEGKKLSSARRDDISKEAMGPKQSEESKAVDVITLKVNSVVSNETWFRTWPERGNDKLSTPHNNISGCNVECDQFNKEEDRSRFEEECLGKDLQNLQDSTPANISDNVKRHVSSTHQSCHSLSPDKTYALKINQNISQQSSSMWANDLSSKCDIEDYSLSAPHSSSTKQACTINSSGISPGKTLIPLKELLQNIPIAYSPVTRQLHMISPSHTQQQLQPSEKCLNLNKEVSQNGLKPQLECIEEEGIGDMCRNVVKCLEDECLSFESPSGTLQRFGTGSLSCTDASSFSSIVSSLSDTSPSLTNDDPDDPASTVHCSSPSESGNSYYEEAVGVKAKRKGLSGFFSR